MEYFDGYNQLIIAEFMLAMTSSQYLNEVLLLAYMSYGSTERQIS